MKSNKKTPKVNSSCSVVYLKVYTHTYNTEEKNWAASGCRLRNKSGWSWPPTSVNQLCSLEEETTRRRKPIWSRLQPSTTGRRPGGRCNREEAAGVGVQEFPTAARLGWLQKDIDSLKPRFNCNTTINRTVLLTNEHSSNTLYLRPIQLIPYRHR